VSSGKEIAYLAKKYPRHHFIYTDIFDATVEYAKSKLNLPNLLFCPAQVIIFIL